MGLTALLFFGLIATILVTILYLFLEVKKIEAYFKKKGIPYAGSAFSGMLKIFLGNQGSIIDLEEDLYKKASEANAPMVGVADFTVQKNLYITDLDLMRSIYVKEFDHFVNRRPIGVQNEFFKKMIVSSESEQWKGSRTKLSPCFTTGKIRKMFEIFGKSSERLETYLKEQMSYPNKKSMDIDFMQIMPKYAMDVIASCAFGIDSKSFEVSPDQKSVFEKMGHQFGFRFSGKTFLKIILVFGAPKIAEMFGVSMFDTESQDYFCGAIKQVLKRRRETGERRDDFLQLMMDVQEGLLKSDEEANNILHGTVKGDEGKSRGMAMTDAQKKWVFEDDDLIANGLQFLSAGFDTTQSAMLFTLYSLAVNQEIQERLYKDVKGAVEQSGGKLGYDAVTEMKYLDMVISESLRFDPPATRTERTCNKDLPVPGTNLVIEKGTILIMPIHGVHHDPKHFPNPKKFDPERFTAENKATRNPYAYMPFGHGPRNCIGNRFAVVKVKAVIAQLVLTFKFEPCSKTKIPMEYDRNPVVKPNEAMWLKATVRND